MRNFFVPQTAHWPVTAERPFLSTTSSAFNVLVLPRHFRQYICSFAALVVLSSSFADSCALSHRRRRTTAQIDRILVQVQSHGGYPLTGIYLSHLSRRKKSLESALSATNHSQTSGIQTHLRIFIGNPCCYPAPSASGYRLWRLRTWHVWIHRSLPAIPSGLQFPAVICGQPLARQHG